MALPGAGHVSLKQINDSGSWVISWVYTIILTVFETFLLQLSQGPRLWVMIHAVIFQVFIVRFLEYCRGASRLSYFAVDTHKIGHANHILYKTQNR